MKKFTCFLLTTSYLLLATPTYAQVNIGDNYGYGWIHSLGQGTSSLVTPIFSIAAFLVLLYFLLGAFNYLKAGNDKQQLEDAKQMIAHALIGFIVLMFAFLLLQFLLGTLFHIEGFRIIG